MTVIEASQKNPTSLALALPAILFSFFKLQLHDSGGPVRYECFFGVSQHSSVYALIWSQEMVLCIRSLSRKSSSKNEK